MVLLLKEFIWPSALLQRKLQFIQTSPTFGYAENFTIGASQSSDFLAWFWNTAGCFKVFQGAGKEFSKQNELYLQKAAGMSYIIRWIQGIIAEMRKLNK